jgi:hypothetical protein
MTTYGYFSKILNDYVKQEIKEIMSKEIFKVGDKVFHFQYGWGEVESDAIDYGINQQTYCVHVRFLNNNLSFTFDGKEFEEDKHSMLSLTEYTLQGFSQERPGVLPKAGELCLVRDSKDAVWKSRNFKKFTTHFLDTNGERWEEFKRIKILD